MFLHAEITNLKNIEDSSFDSIKFTCNLAGMAKSILQNFFSFLLTFNNDKNKDVA